MTGWHMQLGKLPFTSHAIRRMAQRNLSVADVAFVIQYGHQEHRAGALFYVLGRRQLADADARAFERLEGAVVIISSRTDEVVTVYRNRGRGLKDVRHKRKYDARYPRATRWRA